jgi:DNA-directed RNA polymerase subunit RPC12/RpoP
MVSKKSKKKDLEQQTEQETRDEEEEDAKFLLSATRAPRAGSYEHFLIQSLSQTIFMTDDLKRIKAITVSALMVQESERENISVDYELVSVLNQVTSALLNPSLNKKPEFKMEIVSVSWGFPESEENYKTFILPWFNCKPFFWPIMLRKHGETWRTWHCFHCTAEVQKAKFPLSDTLRLPIYCPKCHSRIINQYSGVPDVTTSDQTILNEEPYWSFFFEMSTNLTPQGYDILRNNFIAWAIPQAQLILAELTRMVDPNLYAEMLGLYSRRGKPSLTEKVKEATEGGPKSENPLG